MKPPICILIFVYFHWFIFISQFRKNMRLVSNDNLMSIWKKNFKDIPNGNFARRNSYTNIPIFRRKLLFIGFMGSVSSAKAFIDPSWKSHWRRTFINISKKFLKPRTFRIFQLVFSDGFSPYTAKTHYT